MAGCGPLAAFAAHVESPREDRVDHAGIVHGVRFRLTQPEAALPRWEETEAALRALL